MLMGDIIRSNISQAIPNMDMTLNSTYAVITNYTPEKIKDKAEEAYNSAKDEYPNLTNTTNIYETSRDLTEVQLEELAKKLVSGEINNDGSRKLKGIYNINAMGGGSNTYTKGIGDIADNYREAVLIDNVWIKNIFILPLRDMYTVKGMRRNGRRVHPNIYYTKSSDKFYNTTVGNYKVINPKYQFTEYADIRHSLGSMYKYNSVDLNPHNQLGGHNYPLGRYYSDAIDDNINVLHLSFGIPKFNNLFSYLNNSVSPLDAYIVKTGNIPSKWFYKLLQACKIVGEIGFFIFIGIPHAIIGLVMMGAGVLGSLLAGREKTYYYLENKMDFYLGMVRYLIMEFMLHLGMVVDNNAAIKFSAGSKTDNKNRYTIDYGSIERLNAVVPGFIDPITGLINLYPYIGNYYRRKYKLERNYIKLENELNKKLNNYIVNGLTGSNKDPNAFVGGLTSFLTATSNGHPSTIIRYFTAGLAKLFVEENYGESQLKINYETLNGVINSIFLYYRAQYIKANLTNRGGQTYFIDGLITKYINDSSNSDVVKERKGLIELLRISIQRIKPTGSFKFLNKNADTKQFDIPFFKGINNLYNEVWEAFGNKKDKSKENTNEYTDNSILEDSEKLGTILAQTEKWSDEDLNFILSCIDNIIYNFFIQTLHIRNADDRNYIDAIRNDILTDAAIDAAYSGTNHHPSNKNLLTGGSTYNVAALNLNMEKDPTSISSGNVTDYSIKRYNAAKRLGIVNEETLKIEDGYTYFDINYEKLNDVLNKYNNKSAEEILKTAEKISSESEIYKNYNDGNNNSIYQDLVTLGIYTNSADKTVSSDIGGNMGNLGEVTTLINAHTKVQNGEMSQTDYDNMLKSIKESVNARFNGYSDISNFTLGLAGGFSQVSFQTDYVGVQSVSISNGVQTIEAEEMINGVSSYSTKLNNNGLGILMSTFNLTDLVRGVIAMGGEVMSGLTMGISNIVAGLIYGGKFRLPKVWSDSSSEFGDRHQFRISLKSPYGDPVSQLINLYIPLAFILAGSMPISFGHIAYGQPMLCSAFQRGVCNIELGMITDVQIERNVGNMGMTDDRRSLGLDIHLTITDLDSHGALATNIQAMYNLPVTQIFNRDFGTRLSRFMMSLAGTTYHDTRDSRTLIKKSRDFAKYTLDGWDNKMVNYDKVSGFGDLGAALSDFGFGVLTGNTLAGFTVADD